MAEGEDSCDIRWRNNDRVRRLRRSGIGGKKTFFLPPRVPLVFYKLWFVSFGKFRHSSAHFDENWRLFNRLLTRLRQKAIIFVIAGWISGRRAAAGWPAEASAKEGSAKN